MVIQDTLTLNFTDRQKAQIIGLAETTNLKDAFEKAIKTLGVTCYLNSSENGYNVTFTNPSEVINILIKLGKINKGEEAKTEPKS